MEKIANTGAYQIHVKPQKALTQFLIIMDTNQLHSGSTSVHRCLFTVVAYTQKELGSLPSLKLPLITYPGV